MKLISILENQKNNVNKGVVFCEQKVSYKEIWDAVETELKKNNNINIESNNVGIFINNSIDYIKAYFLVQRMGLVGVPIPITCTDFEFNNTIDNLAIHMIITDKNSIVRASALLKERSGSSLLYNISSSKIRNINRESGFKLKSKLPANSDVALILKSSGTTGKSRNIMLTHKGVVTNMISHAKSVNLNGTDKSLIILPMYFGYCNTSQMLAHIYMGANIHIYNGMFDPNKILRLIVEQEITNTTIVPSGLNLLMKVIMKNNIDYESIALRMICFGGGKSDLSVIDYLNKKLPNTMMIQTYGQTEASPRISTMIYEKSGPIIDCVGEPLENIKIEIRNSNDGVGDIWIKTPGLMCGYYNNYVDSSEVIVDGWLNTGDCGHLDERGRLYITGRKKNIIIKDGINIYPEEIEKVINTVEGVNDVVVVKRKSMVHGEIPIAKIKVAHGKSNDIKKRVFEKCIKKLSKHKRPHELLIVNDIAKTTTGKNIRR